MIDLVYNSFTDMWEFPDSPHPIRFPMWKCVVPFWAMKSGGIGLANYPPVATSPSGVA